MSDPNGILHPEEMNREASLQQALDDVAEGRGASSPRLAALSHLSSDEVRRFEERWSGLSEHEKLALLESLHSEETDNFRCEFNAIYHLAMDDQSVRVRQRAIESSVEDDSRWLLEKLLATLRSSEGPDIRAAAARALGPLAQRAEIEDLPYTDGSELRSTLLEVATTPTERLDVRGEALASAGYFSDESVQRALREAFWDESLRLYAMRGMGHSADPRWLETLLEQCEDNDDVVRQTAARAAGEICDEQAVEVLTELLEDPSMEVRLAAIEALGEIGGEEAKEALVYALEDSNVLIREAAETALEEIESYDQPL
jgi:HEAT repeat protein